MIMKKKYIVPSIECLQVEFEGVIATSQAGTDTVQGDYFKYEEEVDLTEYFDESPWQ